MMSEPKNPTDQTADYRLVKDEGAGQYQLWVGTDLASLAQYVLEGDIVDFVHTETESGFTHRGLATTLVKHALDDVQRRGLKVRPYCEFVRDLIADHAQYLDLVDDPERFGLTPK